MGSWGIFSLDDRFFTVMSIWKEYLLKSVSLILYLTGLHTPKEMEPLPQYLIPPSKTTKSLEKELVASGCCDLCGNNSACCDSGNHRTGHSGWSARLVSGQHGWMVGPWENVRLTWMLPFLCDLVAVPCVTLSWEMHRTFDNINAFSRHPQLPDQLITFLLLTLNILCLTCVSLTSVIMELHGKWLTWYRK